MAYNSYEHPTITRLRNGGYPEPPQEPYMCPKCEKNVSDEETVYEIDGEYFCRSCYEEWVCSYTKSNPTEVADYLIVDYKDAKHIAREV